MIRYRPSDVISMTPSNQAKMPSRVLVIVGPTGVGKTGLSLSLAGHVPLEIISCDSRQIYRYMDIGTAKPTAAERARAPHHCLDICDPDQDFSAGDYARVAREAIQSVFERGNLPVVVGGSGLYVRALLDGFFQTAHKDERLREELHRRLETEGKEVLHAELQRVDPEAATRTHPNNTPRLIRALEVFHLTGTPISRIQKENRDPAPFEWTSVCLTLEREKLYGQINRRVEEMIELGLIGEVKKLLSMGYSRNLNALNSVGYKEVFDYLDGACSLTECIEMIQQNSRRYAKRQLIWFRKERDLQWLNVDEDAGKTLKSILERDFNHFIR